MLICCAEQRRGADHIATAVAAATTGVSAIKTKTSALKLSDLL
jgi:hypothetical protein